MSSKGTRKTMRDLALIVVALLFLPQDSRLVIFDIRPEDWYGEVALVKGDDIFILAKNSGDKKIGLGFDGIERHLLRHLDRDEVEELSDRLAVLPLSYSLVFIKDKGAFPLSERRVSIDGQRLFAPGPLTISTRSDFHVGFVLVAAIVIAFSFLAFVVSTYINERTSAVANKSEE